MYLAMETKSPLCVALLMHQEHVMFTSSQIKQSGEAQKQHLLGHDELLHSYNLSQFVRFAVHIATPKVTL